MARLFAKKKAKLEKNAGKNAGKTPRPLDFAVLQSPVITEKSALASTQSNTVTFRVDRRATKGEVREAIERIYKVDVKAIRTINYLGKVKRTKAASGRRANYKKAYVSLKQGQTIDVVEGL